MTTPFWCLAIACFLPYVWGPFAFGARRALPGGVDNKNPRAQYTQLTGRAAHAIAAQMNAFEALAVFAPAVLVAHMAHADPVWSARLAVAWVVARVLHGMFYLADVDIARSGIFGIGMACDAGLFVLAARAVAG